MRVVPLVAVTIALISGAVAWQNWQATAALTKQATSLRDELAKKNDAFQEQAALLDAVRQENAVYGRELASLREKASTRPPPSIPAQSQNDNASTDSESASAKVFTKMAKDPKLKEVTRQWELAGIKKLYGDFVRMRHLNSQQAKQFFDLLVKEETRKREEGANLLSGGENKTGADEASSASQTADMERQLKLLLGDKDYAEYQDYKKSTGSRLTLLQIQEHFARTSIPLRKEQANTLLQIMLEERDFGQSVLDRMETVLTPEQSEELQRFRDQKLELEQVRIETVLDMRKRKDETSRPSPVPSP